MSAWSLGDLISRLGDETTLTEMLAAVNDPDLMATVEQAAAAEELSTGTWAHEAVGRFVASADDEQWVGLLSACRNALDPGGAALRFMLSASLAPVRPTPLTRPET
jgi:hypothetical protein